MKRVIIHHKDNLSIQNDNEIKILLKLNHPNLIHFYESFIHKQKKICIVMEYADDGDLSKKILEHKKNKTKFSEREIWKIFLQLCNALYYLHSMNIIHRDIKSQNVFLMKNGNIKLGDFGISKILKNIEEYAETSVGTPYFLSPEICIGKKYNYKSDIWMLGCLLFELTCLKKPFEGTNLPMLMNNILTKPIPEIIPNYYSENLMSLIYKLLDKDMNNRPSIVDIFSLPYIKEQLSLNKIKIKMKNSKNKYDVDYENEEKSEDSETTGYNYSPQNDSRLETEEDTDFFASPKITPNEIFALEKNCSREENEKVGDHRNSHNLLGVNNIKEKYELNSGDSEKIEINFKKHKTLTIKANSYTKNKKKHSESSISTSYISNTSYDYFKNKRLKRRTTITFDFNSSQGENESEP